MKTEQDSNKTENVSTVPSCGHKTISSTTSSSMEIQENDADKVVQNQAQINVLCMASIGACAKCVQNNFFFLPKS